MSSTNDASLPTVPSFPTATAASAHSDVQSLITPDVEGRLFVGCYPAGLVYADRKREFHGDYATCAFMSYATLKLELAKDCPRSLAEAIKRDALRIQGMRGQLFSIAGNMQVVLGSASMSQEERDAAYLAGIRAQAQARDASDRASVPDIEAIAKRARRSARADLGSMTGACEHVSTTIAWELGKRGVEAYRVSGVVMTHGVQHHHQWVRVGEVIVDGTLDQFGHGLPELFVGRMSQAPVYYLKFHESLDRPERSVPA